MSINLKNILKDGMKNKKKQPCRFEELFPKKDLPCKNPTYYKCANNISFSHTFSIFVL